MSARRFEKGTPAFHWQQNSQGDLVLRVDIWKPDGSGLQDLTGASARWGLAEFGGAPGALLIDKSSAAGQITFEVDPESGLAYPTQAVVTTRKADWAGIAGKMRHELQVTDAAGDGGAALEGEVEVARSLFDET